MEITEARVLDLLGEAGVRFVIPPFQRAYSWEAEQCDELWRDLMRAARARRTHFLGTLIYADQQHDDVDGATREAIVSLPREVAVEAAREVTDDPPRNGVGEAMREGIADQQRVGVSGAAREVIDGQQRLTTITLILLALAGHLAKRGETLHGAGADDLAATFLMAGGQAKLSLSRADDATLGALIRHDSLPERPSRHLTDNLATFQSKMAADGFDAAELWRGLESLTVMAVRLDDRSKAPDVFESFNSKGVPLVTADMVRNFLLLAESRREQTRLYEAYWTSIAGAFGDDPGSLKLNNAILGWLAVRFRGVRKFGDEHAFSIFKSFCEDEYDGAADELLEELYAFCLVWAENYRYHAVKKYKSADWARIGRKTRVSGRARRPLDHEESREYYQKHFGVDPQW